MITRKTIRIVALVDVVGVLATEDFDDYLWLTDSNKLGGSTGSGTMSLQTRVQKGDTLIWTSQPLEVEVFAGIHGVEIDSAYCEPEQGVFVGTDIGYWAGVIKKDPEDNVIPYRLSFLLGSREEPMAMNEDEDFLPSITGHRT